MNNNIMDGKEGLTRDDVDAIYHTQKYPGYYSEPKEMTETARAISEETAIQPCDPSSTYSAIKSLKKFLCL